MMNDVSDSYKEIRLTKGRLKMVRIMKIIII